MRREPTYLHIYGVSVPRCRDVPLRLKRTVIPTKIISDFVTQGNGRSSSHKEIKTRIPLLSLTSGVARTEDVHYSFTRREPKKKMTEQSQDGELSFAEREANDLRELHLSATFLTPFAVAATQDNRVWLSNNQQDYTDHSKGKWKYCTRCAVRC